MSARRDYAADLEKIKNFLMTHVSYPASGEGSANSDFPVKELKYRNQLKEIYLRERTSLEISLDDLLDDDDADIVYGVLQNTRRFEHIFSDSVQELMADIKESYGLEAPKAKDPLDVFIEQRLELERKNAPSVDIPVPPVEGAVKPVNDGTHYPTQLMRRYEVYFRPSVHLLKPMSVRDVKAHQIGKLVTIKGIVTRITEVKPMMTVATYTCDQCGSETYQPMNGPSFIPMEKCLSNDCKTNKGNGRLYLQTRGSRFVKFQDIKLQEHTDQVPVGNIPRSISIVAKGEQTRLCVPGDHILVTGIFLPVAKMSGFKQLTGGLLSETFVEAHTINKMNKTQDEDDENDPELTREAMQQLSTTEDFYNRLASSIGPEIYGHENLKKALCLLLIGGVDKSPYGMKIRGNINICLMGDPGVAKSQLLGFVDRLSPRSQYTTGRGSSGVGLTAAVLRDPITDEFVLEGGALVLADQGICCIDEFDKMMEADRTAIHEVMEQQTISIAKAGIMTSLNARVSILAAANPAFGRYNVKKSIEENINLPAALLSRFDLLWLIQDRPDSENDLRLARHITFVHQHCKNPPHENPDAEVDYLPMKVIRKYVAIAKEHNPIIPEALTDTLVDAYLEMRNDGRNRSGAGQDAGPFTSARSLLALVRISTALARLRLANVVEPFDVMEAKRLIRSSNDSLYEAMGDVQHDLKQTETDKIRSLIQSIAKSNGTNQVSYSDLVEKAIMRGYTEDAVAEAVNEAEEFNTISLNKDRTCINIH